jgi:hypothetical protein
MESGMATIMHNPTTSGTIPPMMKITGQPYAGIRVAPTSPGTAPPSGMPVNITTSAVARSRLGVNSAFSAMTFGSTPPRAKPLMNRSQSSSCRSVAQADASVLAPTKSKLEMMATRRP